MLNSFDKKQVANLKSLALSKLVKRGIEDKFVIKIRKTNSNWVAQYRGKSQFSSRGAIFWLSSELLNNPDEFVISVLHEYGHVIAEFAWMRSPALRQIIQDNWKGEFHGRPWNEEDFAEEFAQYLTGGFVYSKDALDRAISQFVTEVFEENVCFA